jgi:nucleolar GTP-binding protein
MDLSEQCGYSVAEQVALFHSIKPLFANKTTLLVINKIDVMRPEQLGESDQALLQGILASGDVTMVQSSCYTDEGVMAVRNTSCDKLLQSRVEMKMKGTKVTSVLNKLHLAQPAARDDKARPACVPESAMERVKYDPNDPNRRKLARDLEVENGGAGVFNVDLKENYLLRLKEWNHDKIPEIMDGKNVADFVDPEIEAKLEALELEEERLVQEGFYVSEEEMEDETDEAIKKAAAIIKTKKQSIVQMHRINKGKNRPGIPKKTAARVCFPLVFTLFFFLLTSTIYTVKECWRPGRPNGVSWPCY